MGEIQIASTPSTHQVVETLENAIQVADAVAVAVLKRSRIDLVDDAALPPRQLLHLTLMLLLVEDFY